jgi:hypothetical protein
MSGSFPRTVDAMRLQKLSDRRIDLIADLFCRCGGRGDYTLRGVSGWGKGYEVIGFYD